MYYRRRYYGRRGYKKKKPKPTDMELLGYDRDKLISVIKKTTKKLTCSKCFHTHVISELNTNRVYSGQYGIYCKCEGCGKNLSISSKIDLEDDDELNELNKSIEEFRKRLKSINNKDIKKIFEIKDKLISEAKEHKRALASEHSEKERERQKFWLERRDQCTVLYKDESLLRDVGEVLGLVDIEYTKMEGEPGSFGSWKVKHGQENRFRELSDSIKTLDTQIRDIWTRMERLREWDETQMEKKYLDIYNFMKEKCYDSDNNLLNPNIPRELERIEEAQLKPLIAQKEKRILLLRKIFRTTNGSVYVLENESLPDYYKIGWTDRAPEDRAKELSGTGVPTPYRVAYSKSTNLTGEVEKEIHAKLDKFRPRSNREFFKVDLETIKKTIKETLSD